MNGLALPHNIVLVQPSDVPFSNQMHGFITIDHPQNPFGRPKPQTRRNPLLGEQQQVGGQATFRSDTHG
jgi:hypothetical protein